jgi:hypothetical protein
MSKRVASKRRSKRLRILTAGIATASTLLTGCADATEPTPHEAHGSGQASGSGLRSAHVHGIAVDPTDGAVLLATHDGLFRLDEPTGAKLVSPAIDLMGLAVAGPGRFLASGHPGPGVDLPQPWG